MSSDGSSHIAVSKKPGAGNDDVNGLLWGYKWTLTTLTYSFPTSATEFTDDGYEALNGFVGFNAAQQAAVKRMLDNVSDVCQLTFQVTGSTSANLRFGMADSIDRGPLDTLHAPGNVGSAEATPPDPSRWESYSFGDTFFNKTTYSNPTPGSVGYAAGIAHEIGHSLGLKHGHATIDTHGETFPVLPTDHDSQEYSIMTYRRFAGGPDTGLATNQDFPIGLMQNDIAALQYLYGADFTTNATDSVYTWSTTTGRMSINGVQQGDMDPQRNRIFQTIWDGGGKDTYDFSNYGSQKLTIDLRPGEWTTVSNAAGNTQRAFLGSDGGVNHFARGNIANALLYEGDTRSLIENAIGADGDDLLFANQAANVLNGGAGRDTVSYVSSNAGVDVDLSRATLATNDPAYRAPTGGHAAGDRLVSIENVTGSTYGDRLVGYGDATGSRIDAGKGDDTVFVGDGTDVVRGGLGADTITDSGGNDTIYGGDGNLVVNGGFEVVVDPTIGANGYVAPVTQIDGWTQLVAGRGVEQFTNGDAGTPSEGRFGLDMEGIGDDTNITITQQLTRAEDGVLYRLAFDARKLAGSGARLEVEWGGQKQTFVAADGSVVPYLDPTTGTLVYYFDLVGGAGTGADKNRLTFREIGSDTDANGTLLDNVRMYRVQAGTKKADDNDSSADGNDSFLLGTGSDTVFGEGGNDVATFSDTAGGMDHFDGGSGSDDLLVMDWSNASGAISSTRFGETNSSQIGQAESFRIFSTGQYLFFKEVERFNLKGGASGDGLKGGALKDILIGNGGDDTLSGGGGGDEIDGGAGFDRAIVKLSGSGANTLVLKQVQNGGTVTLSDGTKLTSIEAIDLEVGNGDDFLDVRGTVVNAPGTASTDVANFRRTDTAFSGEGGNDTLAVDLATSYGATFDGGAGAGDLLIMDWSAASQDIFRDTDGRYKSYSHTYTYVDGSNVSHSQDIFFTMSFTGVERFDLTGGFGNDFLYGGSGNDRLNGFKGRDTLTFGTGSDTLVLDWTGYGYGVGVGVEKGSLTGGYDGNFNTGYSSTYAVTFTGAEQFDLTLTENGDSVLTGDGNDIVKGNGGNDTLNTAKGIDIVDGGVGTADRWIADTSAMTASQRMLLDLTLTGRQATYLGTGTVTGIETLTLTTGAGADIIITLASDLSDTVTTGAGNDRVEVAGGRDVASMGTGSDTLVLDWTGYAYGVSAGVGAGSLTGGYDGNFNTGYSSTNRVDFTGVELFDLTLTENGDSVATGDGNDTVKGNGGNDTLNTAKGIDIVDGGTGTADRWTADKAAMTATQAMVLDLTLTGRQATYLGTGTVTGIETLTLTTGAGADIITTLASDLNDTLTTGAGNDRVKVAGGRDVASMGTGTDTLVVDWTGYAYGVGVGIETGSLAVGYAGNFNTGYSSTNRIDFTGVEHFDLTLTGNGDNIRTGDGNDAVKGGGGADTLRTGKGIDTVDGGAEANGDRGVDIWSADKSAATIGMTINLTALVSTYVIDGVTATARNIEALGLDDETGWPTNRFLSGSGNDTIVTRGEFYRDVIGTGAGADRVTVAGGRDDVAMGAGSDTLVLDWTGYGYGVGVGVETGSLTAGYGGNFNTGYSSTNRVDFTGVELFDLTLTDNGDSVATGDGNDTVKGNGGNDTLNTAKGIDIVDGGAGTADRWIADKSAMTAAQAMVLDLTRTGRQATYLGTGTVTGIEALTLTTGAGADIITTLASDLGDTITTGAGADRVEVAGGRDTVSMGTGSDTLVLDWTGYGYGVSNGIETGSLAAGYDGSFHTGYSSTYAVTFTGVEQFDLTLTDNGDSVATGDGNDTVKGNGGNDTLNTAKGIDIVDGGAGTADRWIADKSAMTATQAMVLDLTLTGRQATYLGTGTVTGIETLTLTTGAGADVVTTLASDLSDTITTGAGNDRVEVAGGRDTVSMGTGSDTLVLDWTGYGYGVFNGVETGSLTGGYDGSFHTGYSSTYAVTFTGVEQFDLTLTGNGDSVRTGDGNDILNGAGGGDILVGAGGNDTYLVDIASDQAIETAGGGTDTVKASVSYMLAAGQEIEVLTTILDTATTRIDLTGNERVNTLRGNAGTGILDGGLGADLMYGLAGNDTYLVDNAADQVYEAANGGTLDTVKVSASAGRYALLAGQHVEVLAAADLAGTAALTLTGNAFAQTITGNAGANVLKGGLGADALNGAGGLDTADYSDKTAAVEVILSGNVRATVKVGGVAEDTVVSIENVTGGSGADKLTGDGLANLLDGGKGLDVLSGKAGNDTYLVDSATDHVIEAAGGGTLDTVKASVSYTLAANQEIEALATTIATGTGSIALTGNAFGQTITGNAGSNALTGGGGDDRLIGGGGVDRLSGGLDRDTFDFNAVSETGATATTRDVILDFVQGQDRIDLSTIDANGAAAGDKFVFLSQAGAAFTGTAGQLAFKQEDLSGTASDRTIVRGDVDGNGIEDFQIELKGLFTLTSADFIL